MRMTTLAFMIAGALLAAGCGSDGSGDTDAMPEPDVLVPGIDAGTYQPPSAMPLTLSETGPDQVQAAVAGPDGTFYAAAFTSEVPGGSRAVVVLKLTTAGLDTTWAGGDGIAPTDLNFAGGTDELDVAVQPSGKILVSAAVADEVEPLDTDIAIARLNVDGTLDDTFDGDGVRILDLNSAIIDTTAMTATGGDRPRGLAVDANGRIYLHGVQRGEGDFNGQPRADTDFVTVRLLVDGADDPDFGDGGKVLIDIRGGAPDMTPSSATARGIHILADGSAIASGYATTEGLGAGPQPVLYKLDVDGVLVPAFNGSGVFHDAVLSTQTEIYNIALHGTHLVTGGYGRETGDQNDWVSLRFDVTTGQRDTSWGGAANGVVLIDPSGAMIGDNCRNTVGLPGGETILMGSTGPSNDPAQDAVFVVLDETGVLDAAYGGTSHIYAFGGGAGGNDQLWGGAVSGDNVLLVGWKGGGAAATQTESMNDDSYAIILPLQ